VRVSWRASFLRGIEDVHPGSPRRVRLLVLRRIRFRAIQRPESAGRPAICTCGIAVPHEDGHEVLYDDDDCACAHAPASACASSSRAGSLSARPLNDLAVRISSGAFLTAKKQRNRAAARCPNDNLKLRIRVFCSPKMLQRSERSDISNIIEKVESTAPSRRQLLDTGCRNFNVTYPINPTRRISFSSLACDPIRARAVLRIDPDIECAFPCLSSRGSTQLRSSDGLRGPNARYRENANVCGIAFANPSLYDRSNIEGVPKQILSLRISFSEARTGNSALLFSSVVESNRIYVDTLHLHLANRQVEDN